MSNRFIVTLTLMLVLFASCNTSKKDKPEGSKPNIIYIMADDMGYADIGCYGQEFIQTPNIDRLAKEGMRFTQHYAGNTVCAPSRCALMTGKHMGHAEVRGNKQAPGSGQWPLQKGTPTVATYLKKAGYKTAMIGKWGLGNENTTGDPNLHGFDYYMGYLDQVLAHNYFPEFLIRNGERVYLDNEVKYLDSTAWHKGLGSYSTKKVEYSNDIFAEEALNYIEENSDTTFFLYLPVTIPHDNGEELPGEWNEVPDFGIYANKDWPKAQKGYAAMITRLDGYIGRIMQKLKDEGIDDNTIVFFTSDNGPMPDPDRTYTQFFNSNGPYRGGKRDLYEGGIRIPLIARWPGKIQPDTKSGLVSAFWDFLPTACELAGVPVNESIDGISFLPALLGKEQPKHEYLYWEFTELGGKQAILKDQWKAVRNNVFADPNSLPELYNLNTDPGETTNLSDQNPELANQLSKMMEEVRTESTVFPLHRSQ